MKPRSRNVETKQARHFLSGIAGAAVLGVAVLASFAILRAEAAEPASARQVAGLETRTFSIDKMTCALCPVTVKKAIESVAGVHAVDVDFATKTAKVVFDPRTTNPKAIAAASTNAGYPAHLSR